MKRSATKQPALPFLHRRWWWRAYDPRTKQPDGLIDPVAGLALEDPDGTPVVQNWRKDGWAKNDFPLPGSDFLEAAFQYEVQARYIQKQQGASEPIYKLDKAFPLLTQAEKEHLKAEYPSRFIVHRPQIRDLRDCLNDPRYTQYMQKVARNKEAAEVEVWFRLNLKTMRDADLLASFKRHLRRLRKDTGIKEPVRRQKEYPWATLELTDKWLGGISLQSYDIEKARQLLRRYGKQSF